MKKVEDKKSLRSKIVRYSLMVVAWLVFMMMFLNSVTFISDSKYDYRPNWLWNNSQTSSCVQMPQALSIVMPNDCVESTIGHLYTGFPITMPDYAAPLAWLGWTINGAVALFAGLAYAWVLIRKTKVAYALLALFILYKIGDYFFSYTFGRL